MIEIGGKPERFWRFGFSPHTDSLREIVMTDRTTTLASFGIVTGSVPAIDFSNAISGPHAQFNAPFPTLSGYDEFRPVSLGPSVRGGMSANLERDKRRD